jgi:hypothetical protein
MPRSGMTNKGEEKSAPLQRTPFATLRVNKDAAPQDWDDERSPTRKVGVWGTRGRSNEYQTIN